MTERRAAHICTKNQPITRQTSHNITSRTPTNKPEHAQVAPAYKAQN